MLVHKPNSNLTSLLQSVILDKYLTSPHCQVQSSTQRSWPTSTPSPPTVTLYTPALFCILFHTKISPAPDQPAASQPPRKSALVTGPGPLYPNLRDGKRTAAWGRQHPPPTNRPSWKIRSRSTMQSLVSPPTAARARADTVHAVARRS